MGTGKISQNTLVPISALIFIGSIVFWVSMIYAKTNENSENIRKITEEGTGVEGRLDEVSGRLSRIEGFLSRIDSKLNSKK